MFFKCSTAPTHTTHYVIEGENQQCASTPEETLTALPLEGADMCRVVTPQGVLRIILSLSILEDVHFGTQPSPKRYLSLI